MKNFNIIISGVGGQGLVTLTAIIAEAAMIESKDVKTSELHGLSQRGGSVQTHIRFGDKVYSPLVLPGRADLILGLEISETLRNIHFSNSKTIVLADEYQLYYIGSLTVDQVSKKIKTMFKGDKHLISASKICKEKIGKEVVSGVYLLSYAVSKGLIPLKSESVFKAVLNVIPKKHLEINKKAFELGK